MAHQRVIDYIQAYTHYREGTGGVAGYGDGNVVPHADIDKLKSIGGGRIEAIPRDLWDDAGFRGKGHEFPGSSEIRTWITEGKIDGVVDTDLLGMLLLITFGALTTSTPSDATDTRDHAFTLQNPDNGLQLPSTTFAAQNHNDVGYFLYPGNVGDSLTLRGGRNEYVTLDCSLLGNGRRTAEGSFSEPSYASHRKLRDSISTFKFGETGSLVDYTARIVSWELTVNNNHQIDQAYYPRGDAGLYSSGNPERGMVAGRMLFGNRTVTGRFTLLMEDDAARTAMEQNLAREIEIVSTGDEIETGFDDKLTISLKDVRFRAVRYGEEGDLVAVNVELLPHMPSSGLWADLLTVTLRNGVSEYGTIPS